MPPEWNSSYYPVWESVAKNFNLDHNFWTRYIVYNMQHVRPMSSDTFYAPDRMIGDILFFSCLFVCLLSTLTFAITFEP